MTTLPLALVGLLAASLSPLGGDALAVVSRSSSQSTSGAAARSAEWRSCLKAEAEDSHFWSSEWAALEADLLQLASAVAPAKADTAPANDGHLKADTGAGNDNRKVEATAANDGHRKADTATDNDGHRKVEATAANDGHRKADIATANDGHRKVEATAANDGHRKADTATANDGHRKVEATAANDDDHRKANATAGHDPRQAVVPTAADAKAPRPKSPMAGLKLNLNPTTPADLIPTLAMLKGLYEDGKARIGQLNAREKESKARFAAKQAEHEQRLATIEARFKNHTISEGFHTNETHDENRLWTYWEHVRERQHRQFHTSLKIQHATLEKVKTMIDMYEKTISGKADKGQVVQQLRKVGAGIPEVVFIQEARQDTAKFCRQALAELRAERELLQAQPTNEG